jgi:hypothetical protein
MRAMGATGEVRAEAKDGVLRLSGRSPDMHEGEVSIPCPEAWESRWDPAAVSIALAWGDKVTLRRAGQAWEASAGDGRLVFLEIKEAAAA